MDSLPNEDDDDTFETIQEVGEKLAICRSMVNKLIATGRLEARKIGTAVRITRRSRRSYAAGLPKVGGARP